MRGTCKKLRKVWVDGTYRGAEWTFWVKEKYRISWNPSHVRKDKRVSLCYRIVGSWKELWPG